MNSSQLFLYTVLFSQLCDRSSTQRQTGAQIRTEMAARQQSFERSHVAHLEGRPIVIRVLEAAGLARGAGERNVHVFNMRSIGQGSFGAIYHGIVTDAGGLPLLACGTHVAVKFEYPACVPAGGGSSLSEEFAAYNVRSALHSPLGTHTARCLCSDCLQLPRTTLRPPAAVLHLLAGGAPRAHGGGRVARAAGGRLPDVLRVRAVLRGLHHLQRPSARPARARASLATYD